jgi:hypothetical protein
MKIWENIDMEGGSLLRVSEKVCKCVYIGCLVFRHSNLERGACILRFCQQGFFGRNVRNEVHGPIVTLCGTSGLHSFGLKH